MSPREVSRREFLGTATLAAVGLPAVLRPALSVFAATQATPYTPPESPRITLNFNLDWKFLREDQAGAEAPAFDDAKWSTVTTPHTFNDVDSFRTIIQHSSGDRGTYKGLSWYRKHFRLSADLSDHRTFLEFEGMRQAGDIFLNGKEIGLYENGITAYGVDITDALRLGGQENVLAVKLDNRTNYQERATSTSFEWNANDFNPDFGGINSHVWLHITGKIHQTLPLYYGLESRGVYIYACNFEIARKTADLTVESEVHNGSGDRATVGLSAVIVDHQGQVRAQFAGDPVDMVAGEKSVLSASGAIKEARFWSPEDPYLYTVYTILKVEDRVVDVNRTVTGFRKVEFKGGAGTGGVHINDKFVYLKGFAQRASNEWAGLGQAYPDWMRDFNAKMIRDNNANYIRWMHISPLRVDADAMARYGIVQVCPAGDKERDAVGRQWEQRLEVMRDSMIYYRNNPSILFWEAGNTVVTVEHMQQMLELRKRWDPNDGRVIGVRGNGDDPANTAITPISEYFGVMIGQAPQTDQLAPGAIFRGYSTERRDRAPIIETEDFRDEGARRFWDDDSPPYYGFKKGPNDTYQYTSESFALAGVKRYWEYWENRISNADPAHARWSGYASIYFTDENADGRQDSSEVSRVSGKVDAVRLPKEIYFAERVMQNERPDLHILGHWSYPTGPEVRKTVKPIYVISNTKSVELFLNGKSLGVNAKPESGYIFAFPDIAFSPGTLRAVGQNGGKAVVASYELATAGPPAQIRLTLTVGPHGLQADGADVALIDVEVLDAQGRRCPTDDARIDFTCTGPGVWRGGYNSGKTYSTNNLYLNTELGINRVSVRATRSAGTITVTAARTGLKSAQVQIAAKSVKSEDGIASWIPANLPGPIEQ
jgi:beta-galactosidase